MTSMLADDRATPSLRALPAARALATLLHAQVSVRPHPAGGRRAAELADLQRRPTPASATARSTRSRRPTSPSSSRSGCCRTRCSAPGSRTRSSSTASCTSPQRPNDVMAVDAKTGPRVLAVPLHAVAGRARLLRRQQPRRRDPRRHALHGHARRASDRDRREERQAAVEHRGRRREARVLDHAGAARHQGQGDRRRRRRRVRHPRLHRGVRREDRQGSLALLHHSRARRAGPRHLEAATTGRPAAARCG